MEVCGEAETALEALEKIGDASAVPALLEAAIHSDSAIAQAGRNTLARLRGEQVEAALLQGARQPITVNVTLRLPP